MVFKFYVSMQNEVIEVMFFDAIWQSNAEKRC